MKLRLKGNSIRFRLGRSEVLRLGLIGFIEESTSFGPAGDQSLAYALCASDDNIAGVSAAFTDRRITVRVPRAMIQDWVTTEEVGMYGLQRLNGDHELRILIEKDFECTDAPAAESQEDAFPNPALGGRCPPVSAIERTA